MKKIPSPPDWKSIMEDEQLIRKAVSLKPSITDPKGRYLHWEKMKHMIPPYDLTPEQWWGMTRFVRDTQCREVPLFKDKKGYPFCFCHHERILEDLHWLDQFASGTMKVSEPEFTEGLGKTYLVRSLMEESISSSQLEGAATTRKIAKEMLREKRSPQNTSEQMIINNYLAMQAIREFREESLTPSLILELHSILTDGTLEPERSGVWRTDTDMVSVVNSRQEDLFVPPLATQIPERIDTLCAFTNLQENTIFIHPVVRAIILHFMLSYIHPFVDGNGRTARALFYWLCAKRGYWFMEYLSISRILKRAKAAYSMSYLYTETDGNDLTYFIDHQLGVIRKAAEDFISFYDTRRREIAEVEELLRATKGRLKLNHRQLELIRHAMRNPGKIYTIRGHEESHNIAYNTARLDLQQLAELKLLVPSKEDKTFVYLAPVDIKTRILNLKRSK